MHLHPETVYRTLRIVDSFGLMGCTVAEYAPKYWPGKPRDTRQHTTAGRIFRTLANQGLLLRVGGEGVRGVHHVSDAGRAYLRDATAVAAQVAGERARAYDAKRDFSQTFEPLFGGGRR